MNNIFDYALKSVFRFGFKNLAIGIIFAILVFLISSSILICSSLKSEYSTISKDLPEILVQKYYGGRAHFISQDEIDEFYKIPGISGVLPRVTGQYHFEREKLYLTIFGIESFEEYFDKNITRIAQNLSDFKPNFMISSQNVYDALRAQISTYGALPFFTPDDELILLVPSGVYKSGAELIDNDVIITEISNARKILGIKDDEFSDVTLKISNPLEVDFIAQKIRLKYPKFRVITKYEMVKQFNLLYDFKNGIFLILLIISLFSFCVILYDKLSGIRSEERREIGILKALGWEISDIIKSKLFESLIISFTAFLIGLALAIFYVFFLKAPIISNVFAGYSALKINFDLPFVFDFADFFMLFLLSVPFYVGVSIIPAWKIATLDAGEILK